MEVRYKPTENRKSQTSRHHFVQNDQSKRSSEDCCMKVRVSDKYAPYREESIKMLPKFQSMWHGHPGCAIAAKLCKELLDNQAKPINSALYRAGSKTREFKEKEVDVILKQQVFELSQTESAASIVFTSKEDRFLRF